MKALSTASGLRNATLRDALRDLLGKPFESANIVYVPTASVAEPGDHGWLVADMRPGSPNSFTRRRRCRRRPANRT